MMENIDWNRFKNLSEDLFKKATLNESWGFQIQENTKWNSGLSIDEIEELEIKFGFNFPDDYYEMLKVINGFETLQISIDPDGVHEDEYQRRCYKYPDDFENTKWLTEEVYSNIEYAKKVLNEYNFDTSQIEGFVPLYGHRALVVLKDKTETPVLSIWGNDIILYGESLIDYWCHEFGVNIDKCL